MKHTWNIDILPAAPGYHAPYNVFEKLALGKTGIVVLRELIDANTLSGSNMSLTKLFAHSTTTNYANGSLTTIGPYLARHLASPDNYFEQAGLAAKRLEDAGFDLPDLVRERLRSYLGLASLQPAVDTTGQKYSSCVVRIHADGIRNPLHNDNIMRDGRGTKLSIATISYQLSCIVCLQECDSGGELYLYPKQWHPSDETYKIPDGLGYDEAVVRTFAPLRFKPQAGDVYLINPTYYHSIEQVVGADRLTMGFFIGISGNRFDVAEVWS